MSRSIILILAVCVFTANSAVYMTKDAKLSRIARSPHYGSHHFHDDCDSPPPPPPLVYHTQNWSGVAKDAGGAAQGVFSGAAASAGSLVPAVSEAFSLAASGTGQINSGETGSQTNGVNARQTEFSSLSSSGVQKSKHYNGGSLGGQSNKYNAESSDFNSNTGVNGQYNIKSSGLDASVTASGAGGYGSQPGPNNVASSGFGANTGGRVSTGYSGLSDTSADYGSQLTQKNINTGYGAKSFGSGSTGYSQFDQYKSFKQAGQTERGAKLDAESSKYNSQSGQYNVQSSDFGNTNREDLGSYGSSSGQYESSGLGSKFIDSGSGADSSQFGQNNGQFTGSGIRGGRVISGLHEHNGHAGFQSGHHGRDHGYSHQFSKTFKESQSIIEKGNGRGFNNQGSSGENGAIGSGQFSGSQSSSFGSNRGNYESQSSRGYSGNQGQVDQSEQLNAGSQFAGAQSQSSSGRSGYEKGFENSSSDSKRALANGGGSADISSGSASENELSTANGATGQEDLQATLGGALNLAAQGLQTAQQTPCTSCGKSSYALSNAKSHSGSAIALSIGG